MKKQLIIAALAIATCVDAFSQGYVAFGSTKNQGVSYNPNASGNSATINGNNGITVGFLWAATGTPLVGDAGIPVGNTSITPSWNDILNDGVFQFARNGANLVSVPLNNSGLAQGGWSYNGGVSFPLFGSVAGSQIKIITVAWSSAFATPQLAAQNGSFLGYSALFNYNTGPDSSAGVSTFAASGQPAFGVNPVPEPGTFALAGLGAAALMIFRRRK